MSIDDDASRQWYHENVCSKPHASADKPYDPLASARATVTEWSTENGPPDIALAGAQMHATIAIAEALGEILTELRLLRRLQQIEHTNQCSGDSDCPAAWHWHGCLADAGNCGDPDDHPTYKGEDS